MRTLIPFMSTRPPLSPKPSSIELQAVQPPPPELVQLGVLLSMPSPFPAGKHADDEGLAGVLLEVGVLRTELKVSV